MSDEKAKTIDKAAKAEDGFDNFVSRIGLNSNNQLSDSFYSFNLLTRNRIQLEAAYRGSWIVGSIIDDYAEDMTRAGVTITTNEQELHIKDIYSGLVNLTIFGSICDAIKWGRLYGGAIAYIQIDGQDPATPLRVETIGKGQFKGLVVFDRWQLNPLLTEVITEGPQMGLPKYYQVITSPDQSNPTATQANGQVKFHHSRVIRSIGIQLPYFQAITEMMWGESVVERLYDRLISFDAATMSSANLIERANNRIVKIENYREIIAAGGKASEALEKQYAMMRLMQSNEGLTLMDGSDEFQSVSYSFSGLDKLLLQFGEQLAGACGIPLVRLFGQSPAGLSATGEADIRMYYDKINAQQSSRLTQGMKTIIQILWRSILGKDCPEDMEFTFNPLWQQSPKEKAEIAKIHVDTVSAAHGEGLVTRPMAMQELRQQSGQTGIFSNISDEDIREAELEGPPLPEFDIPNQEEPVKNLDSNFFQRIGKWIKK